MKSGRKAIEAALDYRFRDASLLKMALTPPSAGLPESNQRLEFLGDSLLNSVASVLVFREHPDWDEGALTKLRGMMVCTDSLVEWAEDLEIALMKGPRSPRKMNAEKVRKPLADAVEALLGAMFLDASSHEPNPLAPVFAAVEARFLETVRDAQPGVWESQDAKSTLQERAARCGLQPPEYELLGRSGPDHAPIFTVRVRVGALQAQASAGSLKRAQVDAARRLLDEDWSRA
jgi:ribonuclease-3